MKKIITIIFLNLVGTSLLFSMAPPQQSPTGQQPQGGGFSGLLLLFLALLVIWYFLLIRPQQKKEKKRKEMINNLSKGDDVITIGGIYGKVVQVKDNRVVLKVSDKTNIEVSKSAISGVISK